MRSMIFLLAFTFALSIFAASSSGSSQMVFGYVDALEIVNSSVHPRPMNNNDFKYISDRLYLDKLANNLVCEVRVEEIKQEKRFSTGVKIVEMLKVTFKSSHYRSDENVGFFPLGSELTVQKKNSPYAGTVEEFKLESNDLYNSQFIFQHNGSGQIVWMTYVNDLLTLPCSLK